jgi:hypothetical protein
MDRFIAPFILADWPVMSYSSQGESRVLNLTAMGLRPFINSLGQ